ncbi:MAG TPA: 16S rRNA (cytidine(1402)-2'-O)-methyltransferase [Dehalococcoidia bacterium]|jgi:16S rRNA (cytidine1402-2'-O)-methyltransferase|nr:16S rRNA (cytidine(1402)-2'-O)-methyltransferase [Dehalococcoidia bacterium]
MSRNRGRNSAADEGGFAPGLYVVGTPIGNLEDLTPRAGNLLGIASTIAAEDTRTVRKLLALVEGGAPKLVSLTEHNVLERTPALLKAATDGVVVLVSEAGTPGIADPGARLVEAALSSDVAVLAVPGASALAAAVSVSGFDGSDVHFLGFLPRPTGKRNQRLAAAAAGAATFVFFEAPGRLATSLSEIAGLLGDPDVVVCREMTKVHEEIRRGKASELATHFGGKVRGECTILVRSPKREPSIQTACRLLGAMRRAGAKRGAAAAEIARETGITRAEAYALWEGAVEGGRDSAVLPSRKPHS